MKYNVTKTVERVPTLQGGVGYKQDPKLELIGILSNDFKRNFYESMGDREKRFTELIKQIAKKDVEFVAKAMVYTRSVIGQRSATHYGSVVLAPMLSGTELGKRFYSKREKRVNKGGIVYRLDDMLEIVACYMSLNPDKPLPNSMKKGFKLALENADRYELAKYQAKNKGVSLVDLVNLVHPKPAKEMEATFKELMTGELKQFNTVEDRNTKAGTEVAKKVKAGELTKEEAKEELKVAKTENFADLITTKKIGYLALLRNLRNIIKTEDSKLLDSACELLVNKAFIEKSLVNPVQIDLALEIMLIEFAGRDLAKVAKALEAAYELSIPNLAKLLPEGRTAVVFDTSGSMSSDWNGGVKIDLNGRSVGINKTPVEKAALIAATFAKGVYGDVYHFASTCSPITGWNPNDSINTLKRTFASNIGRVGHGTNFSSIFQTLEGANKAYDRIVIITDEQDGGRVENDYKRYCAKFGTPYIYMINIVGYGPSVMKGKVLRLFGYSADIYEKASRIEIDPKALLKDIEAIII